jgi:CHASE1-domain containing sensor protein
MMQALQTNLTTTASQQQTANSTMKSGIAVGGVALTGAIALAVLMLKRKKKSSK